MTDQPHHPPSGADTAATTRGRDAAAPGGCGPSAGPVGEAPAGERDEDGLTATQPFEAVPDDADRATSPEQGPAADPRRPGEDPERPGEDPRRPAADPHRVYVETTSPALIPRIGRRRDWVDLVDFWFPERYRVPMIATTATSLALTVAFLFLPLAGTDLAAQVARGHFFSAHGWHTIDFRWYGGIYPFGYSVLAGPLNAAIGSRGVGAVSCVLASAAFAYLLARFGVRRPTLGGVLAAMVGVFNLVSGRTTFALGIAIGMAALVAVSLPGRVPRSLRLVLGGVLAVLSVAGSPLAGLFVGLAGGALLLAGLRQPPAPSPPAGWLTRVRRHLGGGWREGLVLCVGALVGLVPSMLFPDGGVQPFNGDSMKVFLAGGVVTFFLIPPRYRALRIGAVLLVAMVLFAYLVPSPIGSNITRLPMLYATPVIVAVGTVDRRLLAGAVVALTWWQPPLVTGDLGSAGNRAAQSAFYQPLIAELDRRKPIGRVEVVPLYDHWESTYVAEAVPLARGWERQVDVHRNPLFYRDTVAPGDYLDWLYRNAVGYVAVPQATKLDKYGRQEADLIAAGLPYLKRVWSNSDWKLYQVRNAQQLVSGVGVLVDSTPTGLVFDTTGSGRLLVRVRWSRWLTLSGPDACFGPTRDGWVEVTVNRPGRYRISSGFALRQAHRC
ncbi:MFS transporter [Actinocatenispora thailandica]|uniref:MFS transporter n=1 Tax=Actinocatenispora thailandica TaxID=227318 RepID=A0A7R7DR46_9ACTN|nr:hypothetical protein [Actinocatenispora thailandica]BCJ36151.1 MFS transporter [Actinocatenispora thailandica]